MALQLTQSPAAGPAAKPSSEITGRLKGRAAQFSNLDVLKDSGNMNLGGSVGGAIHEVLSTSYVGHLHSVHSQNIDTFKLENDACNCTGYHLCFDIRQTALKKQKFCQHHRSLSEFVLILLSLFVRRIIGRRRRRIIGRRIIGRLWSIIKRNFRLAERLDKPPEIPPRSVEIQKQKTFHVQNVSPTIFVLLNCSCVTYPDSVSLMLPQLHN